MSDIAGFVGLSHSPFATLLRPSDPDDPGGIFLASAARAAEAVRALAPDAVVVIGISTPTSTTSCRRSCSAWRR